MKQKIEDVDNPRIGKSYMVRTVKFRRNGLVWHFPVVDRPHRDGKHGLDQPHYHIDWRFMPEEIAKDHHRSNSRVIRNTENSQYYSPILVNEVEEEYYSSIEYLRDHSFTNSSFISLKEAMKDRKMTDMVCPHHKTNLKSCKPIDGVVTCPQHGLRWCVKTGKQVI